jgi:hypothetical protein
MYVDELWPKPRQRNSSGESDVLEPKPDIPCMPEPGNVRVRWPSVTSAEKRLPDDWCCRRSGCRSQFSLARSPRPGKHRPRLGRRAASHTGQRGVLALEEVAAHRVAMRGVSEEVVVAGGSVELCDLAIDVFCRPCSSRASLRSLPIAASTRELCHPRRTHWGVTGCLRPADRSVASADPKNWVIGS